MHDIIGEIDQRIIDRYRGARVVCVGGVAAAWQANVADLDRRGADSFLVVHAGAGAGDAPSARDVELVEAGVEVPRGEITEEFRVWTRLAADPPPHVLDALERFDPDGSALLLSTFPMPLFEFAGRIVHGGRRAEWVALEDKTVVDGLLDRASVRRPPSEIVPVRGARAAARRIDRGAGTVWSGDSREGFNGGATRVRWVASDVEADATTEFFADQHDEVRVAPFVEGVPCSIHGIVGATGVAVFRPCEMLIMRTPDHRFVYCGVATAWDPSPVDREAMREAARRVGATLRAEVAFRGTFTVDGIMGADGFVVTEVNPRFGGGMARIAAGVDGFPLLELHRELIADPTYDPDSAALEAAVLASADAARSFSAWIFLGSLVEETSTHRFVVVDGEPQRVREGAAAIEATVGPASTGSMVRVELSEVAPEVGPMFAPLAVEALRAAGTVAGVEIPTMEPARPVR